MKRLIAIFIFGLFAIEMCLAQAGSAPPQSGMPTPSAQAGAAQSGAAQADNAIRGAFGTTLTKAIDSKKLKEGDTIICQTAGTMHARNGFMIPAGAKVIGHVTEAKARSKGDPESSLTIVFDKIELGKGKEIPMKGVLQAVGPSLGDTGPNTAYGPGPATGRGGAGDNLASVPPPSSGVSGPNSGIHPADTGGPKSLLNSQSTGVLGIHNLELNKDGVLSSNGKEVKLESGSQVLIRGEIEIPVQ